MSARLDNSSRRLPALPDPAHTRAIEHRANLRGHDLGMLLQVLPGEAQQRPAEQLEPVLSPEISAPALLSAVPAVPVGLDSNPEVWVREVEPGNGGVAFRDDILRRREGNRTRPQDGEKGRLEPALGSSVALIACIEEPAERGRPTPSSGTEARQSLVESLERCEAAPKRIVQSEAELVLGRDRR